MRYVISALTLIAAALVALPAIAQPPGPPGAGERGGRFRDPERHQQMLEQFDKDGDGRLSDEERQAMRETFRARFGRGGPGGPPAETRRGGPPEGTPEGAATDAPRPQRHRGMNRPDGRPGPPDGDRPRGRRLEPLFDWFDANGDGALDREEFHGLAEFVGRHHPGPPGERPGFGRRGPDGAPWGDRAERRGPEGRRGPAAGPREGFGRRGPGGGPPRDAGPPPERRPDGPPPEAEDHAPDEAPI